MAYRFNPAPGWPAPPEGWTPPEGWQPDPAWPPAPEGWQFWVWADDAPADPAAPLADPTAPESPQPATTSETPSTGDPVVEAPLSRQDPDAEPEAPLGTADHPEAPFSAHDANTEPQPDQGDGERLQAPFSGEGPGVGGVSAGESDAPPVDAGTEEPASSEPLSGGAMEEPGEGEPRAPFSEQDREAEPPADLGTQEHPQAVFSTDDDASEEPELGQGVAGQPQDPSEPAPSPTPPPAVFPAEASGHGNPPPQPYTQQQPGGGWGQPGGQDTAPQTPAAHPYTQQDPGAQQQHQATGRASAHPAPQGAPKKGKGVLIALIILGIILVIAFVWALVSFFGGGSSANAAAAPVLHAIANAPPTHAG